jgi:carbon monoxide dehydrogenase subunit G
MIGFSLYTVVYPVSKSRPEIELEIQQSFRVPFAVDQVWRHFHDVEGIVGCLPGAALSAPASAGRLALSMTLKLGPIVASFAGDGQLTMDEERRCGSISGSGSDRKSGSRLKGEAAFCLHDESTPSASTRIDIRITYAIAGSLAQFSRDSIVRELAARLTSAFSDNLQAKLTVEQGKPAAAQPLDLGKMLWPMVIARLKRWFGRRGASSDGTPSAGD